MVVCEVSPDPPPPHNVPLCPTSSKELPADLLACIFRHGCCGQMLLSNRSVLQLCTVPRIAADHIFNSHRQSWYSALHHAISTHSPAPVLDILVDGNPSAAVCLLPLAKYPAAVHSIIGGCLHGRLSGASTDNFMSSVLAELMCQSLCLACRRGNVAVARALLEQLWLSGAATHDDLAWVLDQALLTAVEHLHLALVRLLILHGANLMHQDNHGRTPLMVALDTMDADMAMCVVDAMLHRGLPLDKNWLVTVLIENNHLSLLQQVLRLFGGCSDNNRPAVGVGGGIPITMEMLLAAANRGDPATSEVVLRHWQPSEFLLNDTTHSPNQWSPVMFVVKTGNVLCLKKWLDFGGHLTVDQMSSTMCSVISHGHVDMTRFLIDLARRQRSLPAVLHNIGHIVTVYAVERRSAKLLRMLLELGLTGACDDAVISACHSGNLEVLRVLLAHKSVDPGCRNHAALQAACRANRTCVVKHLLDHIHLTDVPASLCGKLLRDAILSGSGSMCLFDILIQAGARLDEGTLLIRAAEMGRDKECLQLLLGFTHPPPPPLPNQEPHPTPGHHDDQQKKKKDSVQADLDISLVQALRSYYKLVNGECPPKLRRLRSYNRIVTALLRNGASPRAHNHEAMVLACSIGQLRLVRQMMKHGGDVVARGDHLLGLACHLGGTNGLAVLRELVLATPMWFDTNWVAVTAVRCKKLPMLQFLVESARADPGAFSGLPLLTAIQLEDISQVQYLLHAGAAVRLKHIRCAAKATASGRLSSMHVLDCLVRQAAASSRVSTVGDDVAPHPQPSSMMLAAAEAAAAVPLDDATGALLRQLLIHAVHMDNMHLARWVMGQPSAQGLLVSSKAAAVAPSEAVCRVLVEASTLEEHHLFWCGTGGGHLVMDFLFGRAAQAGPHTPADEVQHYVRTN